MGLRLSFKKDTYLSDDFVLHSPTIEINLNHLPPQIVTAIAVLYAEGGTEEELSDLVLKSDSGCTLPQFYYYLQKFISLGLICYTVQVDKVSLATLVPLANPYKFQFSQVELDQKYVLSRFAYCHKDNSQIVCETPLLPAQIVVSDWRAVAAIAELAQPQSCLTLTKIPGISADTARIFLSLLLSAKMLCAVREDEKLQEDENNSLAQWEFHDLLFHSRSRSGRHAAPIGKTYRFLDRFQPLPAVKCRISNNDLIELYKPDIQELQEVDYPFTKILEQRKSIRSYADKPITAQQLGEFLYRSARVREIVPRDYIECSNRPYPSGGASYELELYIAVNTCENIPSGLYHYCSLDHKLEKISDRNCHVETLLKSAEKATGGNCLPQILIIFAARFARVSWAYESVAYSLILKHVGVLYQTMYLVATAMDLAPCAIGSGNSDLFATAAGTDYYTESSVGEFILGSRP